MNRTISTLLAPALIAMLAVAPLVAGGNRPLAWAVHAILGGILAAGAGVAWLSADREERRRGLRMIAWPAVLLGLVFAWVLIQVHAGVLAHPLWLAVGQGGDGAARVSINPHETMLAGLRLATAACVFLAAFTVGRDRRLALNVLAGFVAIACGYALLAMVFQISGPARPGPLVPGIAGQFSGTFVNRNNSATYFGLGVIAAAALFAHTLPHDGRPAPGSRQQAGHVFRRGLVRFVTLVAGKSGLGLVVLAVLAIALVLTGSRGGIAATAAALFMLAGLYMLRGRSPRGKGRDRRRGVVRFLVAGVLAGLLLVVLETAGASFAERLATDGLGSEGRIAVLQTGGMALADHWATGAGFGTFADLLPLYRGHVLGGLATWDKAHNDYLELALGLGLPMAIVVLTVVAWPAGSALCGYFRRRRPPVACAVAVAATGLVGIHALVDFSLQIQAVTLSFATLLGLGAAQAQSRRSSTMSIRNRAVQPRFGWRAEPKPAGRT